MKPTLIILAGGKGTRLGDLTKDIPKPMVDIYGKPFLYWLIKHYRNQGFEAIILCVGYKADVITSYFGKEVVCLKDNEDSQGWGRLADGGWLDRPDETIIVNGDTWIEDPLPTELGPWVTVFDNKNGGAQCTGLGKVELYVRPYYDIGTPEGLAAFKEYFKTHPLRQA